MDAYVTDKFQWLFFGCVHERLRHVRPIIGLLFGLEPCFLLKQGFIVFAITGSLSDPAHNHQWLFVSGEIFLFLLV